MNQNLISLEQWAAFVAVVEEGSYAKAAEALNKSQSTVSYAVSRVEESLGAPVLKVSGRKAQLTPLGEVMLRRAQQLIKDAKETEQLARCVAQGWESEVSIAVDVIFPMSKVLDALEAFNQQGKPTRIRVLETSLSGTDEVLLNGQANLVISPRFPPGFIGEQFASIEFLAVAHKDHPLNLLDTSFNVDELAHHRQVVMRDSGVKRNQNAGWLGAEQRITVSHFSTSVEVIKREIGRAHV